VGGNRDESIFRYAPRSGSSSNRSFAQKDCGRKAAHVDELNKSAIILATSGLQTRHKNLDEGQLHRRLADILLGEELAFKIYGRTHHPNPTAMNEIPIEVTLAVIAVLDQLGAPYLIGGSLASAVHGTLRTTFDADLLVDFKIEHIEQFTQALEKNFYVSADAIRDAIIHRTRFNVIHFASAFKVDIFLLRNRPFDARQFENRILHPLGSNPERKAYSASAEDTILAKLDWYRQGKATKHQKGNG
jgi:hypothetical protein